jgi:hypothetical protein
MECPQSRAATCFSRQSVIPKRSEGSPCNFQKFPLPLPNATWASNSAQSGMQVNNPTMKSVRGTKIKKLNPTAIHRIKRIPYPILISIFILIAGFSYGQIDKIEIKLLGNCGLFMTDGNLNIYVDFPYKSGAHGYMAYRPGLLDSLQTNSIFLFTHGHSDHYNRKLFKKTDQKLYGPWPVKFLMPKKRKYSLEELNDSLPGFSITEFKTKHGYSFIHLSYLVEWNERRIFISGDTHVADTMASMKNLDLVFAAPWVLFDANDRGLKIDSKRIIVYHLRTTDKLTTDSDKITISTQNQEFELE